MSSVDIIVPCYRYGRYLRQCVESALTQDGVDVRVLIIDDASPDDTAAIGKRLAQGDRRIAFTRHAVNHGHIHTYNEGLAWARAKYTLLLSADDYLLPHALRRASNILNRNPEVGFVFGRAVELTDNGETRLSPALALFSIGQEAAILPGVKFIEISGSRNIVPTPTAVVRTELQHNVGGYLPELPHAGDMEMWLRIATNSSVGVLGTAQAVYRLHSRNMSTAYLDNNRLPDLEQRKLALDRLFSRAPTSVVPVSLRTQMLSGLAVDSVSCASGAFNAGNPALARQLAEFAVTIDPDVKKTKQWRNYVLKRRIGVRCSRALGAFARLRPTTSSMAR